MGYIPEITNLLNKVNIEDSADDQLYFTQAYLDKEFRENNKIQLDHLSQIFQNMNGQAGRCERRLQISFGFNLIS